MVQKTTRSEAISGFSTLLQSKFREISKSILIRIILGLRQSHRFVRLPREADFKGSVNIVNPREFTMLELVEELIAFAGSRSNLEFKPLPSEVTKHCQSDIRDAKQMFARRLNLFLEEDLNRTISN